MRMVLIVTRFLHVRFFIVFVAHLDFCNFLASVSIFCCS